MIEQVVIIGFSAAFGSLILNRKSGPYRCFSKLRAGSERIPLLRNLVGAESHCETCCAFWFSIIQAAAYSADILNLNFLVTGIAAAAFAVWLMPTMSAQILHEA